MNLKSFPYKWTCLLGIVFLASVLWWETFLDGPSFVLVALVGFGLLASLVGSIVLAIFRRSKSALHRVLINVATCLLFFPMSWFGDSFRERIFVRHLSRFEETTNFLIENEASKSNAGTSSVAQFPPGYSDLHVADKVLIDRQQNNITIRYITRDSSALGHRGYLYRSDDDVAALEKEFPRLEYTHVAPHWFFFSD
jgi:hypothetical protein